MQIDFEDCLLYITLRSPFARRVRAAFIESGIRFEEYVLDLAKNPHPEYLAVNALKRVPAVILKGGEIIVDSNQILFGLHQSRSESALLKSVDRSALFWSGMATGLCEQLVAYFFEMQKPDAMRDRDLLVEIDTSVAGMLKEFEKHIQGREYVASVFGQADIDVVCALDYLSLRYSKEWMSSNPHSAAYLKRMQTRPSLRATQPPPPAE